MSEWSEIIIPVIIDDDDNLKPHQTQQTYTVHLEKLNWTEFHKQLGNFRYVNSVLHVLY